MGRTIIIEVSMLCLGRQSVHGRCKHSHCIPSLVSAKLCGLLFEGICLEVLMLKRLLVLFDLLMRMLPMSRDPNTSCHLMTPCDTQQLHGIPGRSRI